MSIDKKEILAKAVPALLLDITELATQMTSGESVIVPGDEYDVGYKLLKLAFESVDVELDYYDPYDIDGIRVWIKRGEE